MRWLRQLWPRQRMRDDLAEEIQSHLEQKIEELVAGGMGREEAIYAAKREFGNVTRIEERGREMWAWPLVESVWADVKFAIRQLRKSPGFALTAVVTLALGIGVTTAVFSVVEGYLLRPLPYRDSGRIVVLWEQLRTLNINRLRAPSANYLDFNRRNRVFDGIAAIEDAHFVLTNAGPAEQIFALRVTANLFPIMGIRPAFGRVFVEQENQPGRGQQAILSDAVWRGRFGADRSILGRNITLDGADYQIVGVLPGGLRFTVGDARLPDVWLPLTLAVDPSRSLGRLQLVGRLKSGVSIQQAQANMSAIAGELEQQYHLYRGPHGEDAGYAIKLISLRENLVGDIRHELLLMLGAVAFVLLIACANVANLLLAHGASRHEELSLRVALGARRSRLLRMLLIESAVLAMGGGCLGACIGVTGVHLLRAWSPYEMSRVFDISADWSVLLFAFSISCLTAILFGLAPSFSILRRESARNLRGSASQVTGDRSRLALGNALVVCETALSVSLVIGAGLLVHSFIALQRVSIGFRPEGVVTGRLTLPSSDYKTNQQVSSFYDELIRRVTREPGIDSFAVTTYLPVADNPRHDPFSIQGRPWKPFGADKVPQFMNDQAVSGGFFNTMQIPLMRGRLLSEKDREGAPAVAVVNETMVRGFWPHQDPIGRQILLGAPRPGAVWMTIVGVVGDVHSGGPESNPLPEVYVALAQRPSASVALVARPQSSEAGGVLAVLRHEVKSLDKDLPLQDGASYDQLLSNSFAARRYSMLLLSGFGAIALVLAATGIYGLISHSISLRTREIGIRMAFGAQRGQILLAVVGQGLVLAGTGLALGLFSAMGLTRLLANSLFQVRAADPLTYGFVVFILLAVASLASYLPARRAASVDPMQALRAE